MLETQIIYSENGEISVALATLKQRKTNCRHSVSSHQGGRAVLCDLSLDSVTRSLIYLLWHYLTWLNLVDFWSCWVHFMLRFCLLDLGSSVCLTSSQMMWYCWSEDHTWNNRNGKGKQSSWSSERARVGQEEKLTMAGETQEVDVFRNIKCCRGLSKIKAETV
jgi:hypothetical protein